jgi:cytochrome c-L
MGRVSLFVIALLGGAALAVAQGKLDFRHPLDNSPLDVTPRPNEKVTDAVKQFHTTGRNPYEDDPAALEAGQDIYRKQCQACHLPDGSGKLGPSLIDDAVINPRAGTAIGDFEILMAGARGAMQSFARRGMSQDDMLKVIAYTRSLSKRYR